MREGRGGVGGKGGGRCRSELADLEVGGRGKVKRVECEKKTEKAERGGGNTKT